VTVPFALVKTISLVPTEPTGTVSVTDVDVFDARVAAVPPIVAEVRVARFVPVTTVVPPPAKGLEVTEIAVIVGGGKYVYPPADVALGPGVLTTTSCAPKLPGGVKTVTEEVFGKEVICA
jgi:hypothetical protein